MNERPQQLRAEALSVLRDARLLALDVDGVLTDGRVVYGEAGETQHFDVHDGAGLKWLMRSGVRVVWITGRGCEATQRRADELGIERLVLARGPKAPLLAELQEELRIAPPETIAMGDDLADLGLFSRAGFRVAPSNARPEVCWRADLVTQAAGGRGAVRELCERILRERGQWNAIVEAAAGADTERG